MACSCTKNRNVAYLVKYKNGTSEQFPTSAQAQAAIRAAKGGTMRVVKPSPTPTG